MPDPRPDILLVEDTLSLARVYGEYLRDEPITLQTVATGAEALEAMRRLRPAAVLLDLKLPDMDGLDILRIIRQDDLADMVIVITAHGSVNVAVGAMQAGATDFIVKPFTADRLIVTLRNALEQASLRTIVATYRDTFDRREYCRFIGSSLPMQAVYRIIESAASSRATVFVTGESGTGKELAAEAVHSRSPRSTQALVAINCGAIPGELMESEIFGHVKGAFTGAVSNRDGAATRADKGTLFLDEICEMPMPLQTKLLRFIQTGTFQRVGGGADETVDVRFICATNRDPWKEVLAGRFREDLYYRLHVIPVLLPPLRDRDSDVLDIADHVLARVCKEEGKSFTGFDDDARLALQQYDWPGNVRELENTLRNVVVLNDDQQVSLAMLPERIATATQADPDRRQTLTRRATDNSHRVAAPAPQPVEPLHIVERRAIEAAISQMGGNIPKAAEALDVSPSTLYRKLAAWQEADQAAKA
ncbi:MAG: sigma-54 dependent transcriptional regulator [Rhodospirillales bacterium]